MEVTLAIILLGIVLISIQLAGISKNLKEIKEISQLIIKFKVKEANEEDDDISDIPEKLKMYCSDIED